VGQQKTDAKRETMSCLSVEDSQQISIITKCCNWRVV